MFTGPGRPSAQARRYVYLVIAAMLGNKDEQRWFIDGTHDVPDEFDRRRIRRAIELVKAEMMRKGSE